VCPVDGVLVAVKCPIDILCEDLVDMGTLRRQKKEALYGMLLVLPSVVVIGATAAYPLVKGLSFSFFKLSGFAYDGPFVGFANYARVISRSLFMESFRNNAIWAFGTLAGQILVGLVTALLLNRAFRGRSVARGIILFPYIIPGIIAVIVWRWMLHDQYGVINLVLKRWVGLEESIHWLATPTLAMVSLILVGIWKFFPFVTICFLARLQIIPPALYDAAKVDGASPWREFWHVTLPQLREVFFVVVLLRGIFMYLKFDIPWLLTAGGPGTSTYTLPIMSYVEAFRQMERGTSAAIACVLFATLVVVALVYFLAFEREESVV
jgi:multiple sugar transport system permease protein